MTSCDEVDRTANPFREPYYLSKSLRNLLRRMLNLLPNKRCTVQEVQEDVFFTNGYCPASLSWDTITEPPVFIERQAQT